MGPALPQCDSTELSDKHQEERYKFEFATPPEHFVTQYVQYAKQRTDAPWDYHEAVALALLAAATPGLRARVAQYARGLPTGAYFLLLGESTRWRKSTTLDFGRDILELACPEVLLSTRHGSPESLVEELSTKSNGSAVYINHELGDFMYQVNNRPHLAGFAGLLCELFDGRDYSYRRATKRRKDGTPVPDLMRVENCSFSIIAAATPASVFRRISVSDIGVGVWPRFAIIWPEKRPPRMRFHERAMLLEEAHKLASWLGKIKNWSSQSPAVRFTERALIAADDFIALIEQRAEELAPRGGAAMLQRLPALLLKISMLIAAGHEDALHENALLAVSQGHVAMARKITNKWLAWAEKFVEHVGETEFETQVQRCLNVLKAAGGTLPRYKVAQAVNLPARTLDDIEQTLVDRRRIYVTQPPAGKGRPPIMWVLAESLNADPHEAEDSAPGAEPAQFQVIRNWVAREKGRDPPGSA